MNILFIHPSKDVDHIDYGTISFGYISIANYLIENSYRVSGINIPLEISIDSEFSIEKELLSKYDVIFISLHWYEHYKHALYIAKLIKNLNKNIKVVVGGMTATIIAEELINKKYIDCVLKGNAEESALSYVQFLEGKKITPSNNILYKDRNNNIVNTPQSKEYDINKYDFCSIDFLKHHKEYLKISINGYNSGNHSRHWLLIARGCHMNCNYCGGSKESHNLIFGTNKLLFRNLESVLCDIEKMKSYSVQEIRFNHDLDIYKDRIELFKRLNLNGQAIYYESFNLPSLELIDEISQYFGSKSRIVISPTSGNVVNRSSMGKNFSNESFMKVVEYGLSKGINFDIYFTLNIPGENYREFMETVSLANKLSEYDQNMINIYCMSVDGEEIGSINWSKKPDKEYENKLQFYHEFNAKEDYAMHIDKSVEFKKQIWNAFDELRGRMV